jgi:phosphate transport system permease protein
MARRFSPSSPEAAAAASGATGVAHVSLVRTPSARSRGESAIKVALLAAALVSVVTTVLIVLSLVIETVAFFGEVPFHEYLFGTKWSPLLRGDQQSFGVVPLVTGTLYLTAIGLLVAIPLGLLCAIYLSEYATPRVRRIVKPVLEVLAGVPTIVFGYFALTFFTPEILRGLLHIEVNTFNALSAGIILGLLVLPTIASVAEDAMSAVPQSLREGAFGLGANKFQVSLRVVFPAALSGIVAALVLGASRAVGETVIILIAGGQRAQLGVDPTESYQSMAAFIAATSRGDIPTGSIEFETIFVVGFTLFLMTLLLNAVSIRFVRKYRQVYE